MSALLGEVMKAIRRDPGAYDKLGADENAEIITLDEDPAVGDSMADDFLGQLKKASEEIDKLTNEIAEKGVLEQGSEKTGADNGQEKKAKVDTDDIADVKEYLINGVLKEAADEGVLEAGRAVFEKEVPIYSTYIKTAVVRVKQAALSPALKKVVFYGLTGLGGAGIGAGAMAFKNRSDMNRYRKEVAEAFMQDEQQDQQQLMDVARRAYQLGLMRAGKEGK